MFPPDLKETFVFSCYRQAYFGTPNNMNNDDLERVRDIFSSEEVVKKGLLSDAMCEDTAFKEEAWAHEHQVVERWTNESKEEYVKDAGWYFKTIAVQEIGEIFFLSIVPRSDLLW